MSSLLLLVALWAAIGIPVLVRYAREGREIPMEQFQRAMGALQGSASAAGPAGGTSRPTAARRRAVSTLLFLPGLGLAVVGTVVEDASMLAVAVALVNLGTVHRLLALGVDRTHARPAARVLPPSVPLPPAPLEPPFEPGVDERAGDGQTWGDGWQIVGAEPRGVRDLVLVDADVP